MRLVVYINNQNKHIRVFLNFTDIEVHNQEQDG